MPSIFDARPHFASIHSPSATSASPRLGRARAYCYEGPKTTEFGTAGSYWEATVKKIDVSFREANNRIHPKSHIGELRGPMPTNFSFPTLLAYTAQLASRLQNATLKMTNQINELDLKVTNCDLRDVVAGE